MDIWKHGTYVDVWSIVHFLSGFLLSGIMYAFGLNILTALTVSTILLFTWELFEWVASIIEPSLNVAMDIVVGVTGFAVGAFFYYLIDIPLIATFFPVLITTGVLSVWGFVDFKLRGYR